MNIVNNTPIELFYGLNSANSGDCGTIDAGGTADWPAYDNQDNVTVSFAAYPASDPPQITPFTITIPESGTGMSVTIGIYQE